MSVKEKGSGRTVSKGDGNAGPSNSSSSRVKRKLRNAEESSDEEDGNDEVLARTGLDLSNHPIPPLDALAKTIAQFSKLQKLDLSSMKSSSDNEKGLSSLQWLSRATRKGKEKAADELTFGDNLTWLKMTDNPSLGQSAGSEAWNGIENLTSLAVLNAASCALILTPPASALLKLTSLAALVLAHNSIEVFNSIPHLPNLNTLILSHNKIVKLPKDLAANLPSLKKLSITQNALQWTDGESPLPDFTLCSHLREMRLSGNSRLHKLPTHLTTWGRGEGRDRKGTGLETLEMADCGLKDWTSIDPVMKMASSEDPPRKRRGLGNLNLKGNAVASTSKYRQRILGAHSTLRTLDGEKVEKKSIEGIDEESRGRIATRIASQDVSLPKAEARESSEGSKNAISAKETNEEERGSKPRVRGKRGGRLSKVEVNGNDVKGEKLIKKPAKSDLKPESSKTAKDEAESASAVADERLTRRAGPPPTESIKKIKDISSKVKVERPNRIVQPERKEKKRKAWDETSGERRVLDKKRVLQASPPPQKEREKERAQTSVAAVIQLNKKQKVASHVAKPIWGQIGSTEASLGNGGSAWD